MAEIKQTPIGHKDGKPVPPPVNIAREGNRHYPQTPAQKSDLGRFGR